MRAFIVVPSRRSFGQVAFVTGRGQGIALAFANEGADVAIAELERSSVWPSISLASLSGRHIPGHRGRPGSV
jgi:hypothetical protein